MVVTQGNHFKTESSRPSLLISGILSVRMSTLVERIQQQEQYRARPELRVLRTTKSLEILHRISFTNPELFETAARAFQMVNRAEEGQEVKLTAKDLGVEEEIVAQLLIEIDRERLLQGDQDVMERKVFLEARKETQQLVKEIRSRGLREYVDGMDELMTDKEKETSELYREMNEVLQNVAREMGFRRPVVVEITRSAELNAFIFQVDKEGESYNEPSDEPVRVFVHAGLVSRLDQVLKKMGTSGITKDHLAGLLGHELQHVIQPEYDLDKPPQDKDISKRFEYDSDLAGMEAADRAGYNPRGSIELYQALAKLSQNTPEKLIAHFFGKHPISENRVKALEGEFQRPERVWFSADVTPESLSVEAVTESKELSRDVLLKKIDDARTSEDWDAILRSIEENPRATFQDAEYAMRAYKVFLDAQSWTVAAINELETGALGLSQALVYAANAAISNKKRPSDIKIWSKKPFHENEWSKKVTRLYGIVTHHISRLDKTNLPSVLPVSTEKQGEMIKTFREGVFAEASLLPLSVDEQPIQSLQELIENTTPAAKLFWDHMQMDNIDQVDKREVVLSRMAKIFGQGEFIHVSRSEEDMTLRGKAIEENADKHDSVFNPRSVFGFSATYSSPKQSSSPARQYTHFYQIKPEFLRTEMADDRHLTNLQSIAKTLFEKEAGKSDASDWLFSSNFQELFFQTDPTEFPPEHWKDMVELYRHLPILEAQRNSGLPKDIQDYAKRSQKTLDTIAMGIKMVLEEDIESLTESEIGERLFLIREMANTPHLRTISDAYDSLLRLKKALFTQWVKRGLENANLEELYQVPKTEVLQAIVPVDQKKEYGGMFVQMHDRLIAMIVRFTNPTLSERLRKQKELQANWKKEDEDRRKRFFMKGQLDFLASELFARYMADSQNELDSISRTTIQTIEY